MNPNFVEQILEESIVDTLARLTHKVFPGLNFSQDLENRFEADSRKARSHRLWLEGLCAILIFNACLVLDFAIARDTTWMTTVLRTAAITPVALAVNMLMLRNPTRRVREGSISIAIVVICIINLAAQGNSDATTTLLGSICLLISAFFAGVVMRLRFAYAAGSIFTMLVAGLWYLNHATCFNTSASVFGSSLMVIGFGIILIASYSLEREERTAYLLCLQRDAQSKELANANATLKHLSDTDRLTGLPNRNALEERINTFWAECKEKDQPLSAVMIDIDHFKQINDLYGHLYGDEALRRIGALLPQALRNSEDMTARFGGEEFVILLPNADIGVALAVAERVRQLVETAGTPIPEGLNGETAMWTTVSCGVSCCMPAVCPAMARLMEAADKALYDAKHAGRNRVAFRECRALAPVAVTEISRRMQVVQQVLRAS